MNVICPRCGVAWPDDVKYCPHDGAKVVELSTAATLEMKAAVRAHIAQAERRFDPGDLSSDYKVLERIGGGGMASVFKAEHVRLGTHVAIKVLHSESARRPDVVHRFFREAKALKRINHPNIVDIKDFVEGEEHPPYIVMELLQGQDLADYILDNGALSAEHAVEIGSQICDAMMAAHRADIVHRDLKPENVFLEKGPGGSRKVKLLDFGVAKFLATTDAFLKTRTGEAVGTPEYMAPEQLQGRKVDHRTDTYALGVILYEMLAGQCPYSLLGLNTLLKKKLEEIPEPPSRKLGHAGVSAVLPALEAVVMRCLERQPEDRVQSMEDLKELLGRSLEHGDTSETKIAQGPVRWWRWAWEMARRWRWVWEVAGRWRWVWGMVRRWGWVWAAALGAVLCAAALVIWAVGFKTGKRGSADQALPKRFERSRQGVGFQTGKAERGPERRLTLSSTPPGASVFRLDGHEFMGRTPVDLQVPKGRNTSLVLRLEGYSPFRLDLEGEAAGPFHVQLAPAPRQGQQPRRVMTSASTAGTPGKTAGSTARQPRTTSRARPARRWRRVRRTVRNYGTVNPFESR